MGYMCVSHGYMCVSHGVIVCMSQVHVGRSRVLVCKSWVHVVASELKDPTCHSDECQIGSFSSEATMCVRHGDMCVSHGVHVCKSWGARV